MSSNHRGLDGLRCGVVAALLALTLLSCGSEAVVDFTGQGGTAAGGAGGAGGVAGSAGTGACDGVNQPSVTIVITNHLDQSFYLDWSTAPGGLGLEPILRYERLMSAQWVAVPLAPW